MGNSQSIPRNDKRRSNRLSKPLTRAPPRPEQEQVLSPGLIGWQNPWVGAGITNNSRQRPRKIPSTVFESDAELKHKTPERHFVDEQAPLSPCSVPIGIPGPSTRRKSQAVSVKSPDRSSLIIERPRRANSVQTPLQRQRSVVAYDEDGEDATSSNTHFRVGNQRFSLTRRRSLLTRPGIATRRSTGAVRRLPSPIGEPRLDELEPSFMRWSLPPRQRPSLVVAPPERPTSPTDPRYTQLGALKLGSLRVVNGSASPCPSDRVPLDLRPIESVPQPCLEIPSVVDVKKSDDVPGSPFSFEKSPTITVLPRPKALFPREIEDEGIAMCTDLQIEKSVADACLDRSNSRSLDKTDSGYSSANSLHSVQRSVTRLSLDSQTSGSGGTLSSEERIQRQLSLQGVKAENFSRPLLTSPRWYDSSSVALQPGTRTRRSTLCAPRFTEYSGPDAAPEPRKFSYPGDKAVFTSSRSSTSSDAMPVYEQVNALRRSMSGQSEAGASRSRSRSRGGSRIWGQRPGIEVPPLPTILSPDQGHGAEAKTFEYPLAETRGRPRSRGQEHRRHKVTTQVSHGSHYMESPLR